MVDRTEPAGLGRPSPVPGVRIPALPRVLWPPVVHWLRFWRVLAPNARGAVWVLVSALFFTVMATLAKLLGARLPSIEVAFFRTLIGLLAVLPFMFRMAGAGFRTRRPFMHLWRGLIGNLGMICGFYALAHLPLADANAISFARTLFLIPLAMILLQEKVGIRRLTATALGFVGVLIILRPAGSVDPAALVAVLGALFVADAVISVKILTRTDSTLTLLFYSSVIGLVLTAVPTALFWVQPTPTEFGLLLLMGLTGVLAHNCFIRGYAVAEASAVNAIDYSRLVFAALAGLVVFNEVPDGWTLAGAALIVATTLYIVRREAALAKEAPPVDPEDAGVGAIAPISPRQALGPGAGAGRGRAGDGAP